MRHRIKKPILDRAKAPREMMLKNLAASVLLYEKVKTTKAKAKAVKSIVDKMITIAKQNDLTARRALISALPQPLAVKKAMDVLATRYADRKGGYTRLIKIGQRQGDGAEMVQIELV